MINRSGLVAKKVAIFVECNTLQSVRFTGKCETVVYLFMIRWKIAEKISTSRSAELTISQQNVSEFLINGGYYPRFVEKKLVS